MDREQAHAILMKYMEGENYITHSYAVEAIMRGLAKDWRQMRSNTGEL